MDLEAVHREHVAAIYAFAVRRLGNPDQSWDVVSETFLVAWRHRRRLPSENREQRAWLFAIATNVLRNAQRSEVRRRRLVSRLGAQRPSVAPDPADLAGSGAVGHALASLSPADRHLLQLVAWEGLDLTGLAQALQISPATAKVRLSRARQRLAAALAAADQETPR